MPLKYIEMDDWGVALWLRKPILYGMDDLLTFPDFGSLENELWIHSQIKDIQACPLYYLYPINKKVHYIPQIYSLHEFFHSLMNLLDIVNLNGW